MREREEGRERSTVTRYHLSSPCVFGNFCSRVWKRMSAFSAVGSEGASISWKI